MSDIFDFNKRPFIPEYQDLTFNLLRDLLVKIVNTLYYQNSLQSQFQSSLDSEFKIRPTYSEIITFVAKRAGPEAVEKTYISLPYIEKISNELETRFEIAAQTHKRHIDTYTNKLNAFKDSASEHLRSLNSKVEKYSDRNKNLIQFVRNFKKISAKKMRLQTIFTKWKNTCKNKAKGKSLLKKILKTKDRQRLARGWNRLHGAYLLCRLKNYEGKAVRALLKSDDCQNKLLEILPEVMSMKKSKANTDDLLSLASSVQRINYTSVFTDLTNIVHEESLKIKKELLELSQNCEEKLSNFKKNLEKFSATLKSPEFLTEVSSIKSQVSSLSNMHILLSEKVSRIDYCNKKEENEFKLEVLTKQLKNIEDRMLNISNSQDNIHDQTVYLKNILQIGRPNSKGSARLNSTAGTRTGESGIGITPVLADGELTVSGVYLRPGKRVSSASPGKQKVFNLNRKHRIPTSFSSTFSIAETPTLGRHA